MYKLTGGKNSNRFTYDQTEDNNSRRTADSIDPGPARPWPITTAPVLHGKPAVNRQPGFRRGTRRAERHETRAHTHTHTPRDKQKSKSTKQAKPRTTAHAKNS